MATKSILKTVHLKDQKSVSKLANALENAQNYKQPKVTMNHMVSDASRDEIKAMFLGRANDRD